jgi:hypothetical protein
LRFDRSDGRFSLKLRGSEDQLIIHYAGHFKNGKRDGCGTQLDYREQVVLNGKFKEGRILGEVRAYKVDPDMAHKVVCEVREYDNSGKYTVR